VTSGKRKTKLLPFSCAASTVTTANSAEDRNWDSPTAQVGHHRGDDIEPRAACVECFQYVRHVAEVPLLVNRASSAPPPGTSGAPPNARLSQRISQSPHRVVIGQRSIRALEVPRVMERDRRNLLVPIGSTSCPRVALALSATHPRPVVLLITLHNRIQNFTLGSASRSSWYARPASCLNEFPRSALQTAPRPEGERPCRHEGGRRTA